MWHRTRHATKPERRLTPLPNAAAPAVALASGSMGLTLLAGAIQTLATVLTGGAIAWLVYRYVGVGVLRRAWFNLDLLWGVLLIVVGTWPSFSRPWITAVALWLIAPL